MNYSSAIEILARKYNLNFYIYNENDSSLPLSVRLEMCIDTEVYESWGVSTDRDLAFFKAFMELVERVCLRFSCPLTFRRKRSLRKMELSNLSKHFKTQIGHIYPDNSNGMAVGTTPLMAKISAERELIERHTILTSILLEISPHKVKSNDLNLPNITGHSIHFYYWECSDHFVVVALDRLPNQGYLITHSCSKSLKTAMQKAYEELVPNIIFYNKNKDLHRNDWQIIENDISSFSRYWKFSGDTRVYDFLEGKESLRRVPDLRDIFLGNCLVPEIFNVLPFKIFCYRAISPQAQQLFFSEWTLDRINPAYRDSAKLPLFPHFIS